MVEFPTPVGGTPLPDDFVPSIVFAILYCVLVPFVLYRMFHRRSRCTLLIGSAIFTIERVVIFSLRASQARNERRSVNSSLTTYMQVSFGMGFIGLANDLVGLFRCLLVNPTFGSDTYPQSPAASSKESHVGPPPAGTRDRPRVRTWVRRVTFFMTLAFLGGATTTGIIANSNYSNVFNDQSKADATMKLRYISAAVVLGLTYPLFIAALWGSMQLSRISSSGVKVVCAISTLTSIVAVYRLAVMHHRTESLTAPSPLNTDGAKAAFYIFHVLPEWLVVLVLFTSNVRKTFGTGLFGDWRRKDETEEQKRKREAKEAKKRQKTPRCDRHFQMDLVGPKPKGNVLVQVQNVV